MNTREIITKIDIVSVPLAKHRYRYNEFKKTKEPPKRNNASQLLMNAYKERERKEELIQSLPTSVKPTEFKQEKPKEKIRRLKKPNFTIYDYTEIEHDQLEEDVAALINQDGYYDEMLPWDEGVEEDSFRNIPLNKVLIGVGFAIAIVIIMLYMFGVF